MIYYDIPLVFSTKQNSVSNVLNLIPILNGLVCLFVYFFVASLMVALNLVYVTLLHERLFINTVLFDLSQCK